MKNLLLFLTLSLIISCGPSRRELEDKMKESRKSEPVKYVIYFSNKTQDTIELLDVYNPLIVMRDGIGCLYACTMCNMVATNVTHFKKIDTHEKEVTHTQAN